MESYRRSACRCRLPAQAIPGSLYCCKCGLWWLAPLDKRTWKPVSTRKVLRECLAELKRDIAAFENGAKMPDRKRD